MYYVFIFYLNCKLANACRSVAAAAGIYAFVLSKRSINTRRYENMKARQRMQEANLVD